MVTAWVLVAILTIAAALVAAPRRVSLPPAEAAAVAQPAPADRTAVLLSQFTAGVRGSRAPPAASA